MSSLITCAEYSDCCRNRRGVNCKASSFSGEGGKKRVFLPVYIFCEVKLEARMKQLCNPPCVKEVTG